MPKFRVGISGWVYAPWRGVFYPKELPHKRELEFASGRLNSIEINGTFYSLQRPGSFQKWYSQTPADFMFTLKGPRFITHIRRLRDVQTPLANFLASGVLCLKEKLGPILWQFPPNFRFDADRFDQFFELLPRDTLQAARLAKGHDSKMAGRAWARTDGKRPIRYAIEVRHDSFLDPAFIKLARKHNLAVCIADTGGKWPQIEDITADFIYVRLHGPEELYASGYDGPALDRWAARIRAWSHGKEPEDARRVLNKPLRPRKSRDVFVYFDNDLKVKAPFDAMALGTRFPLRPRGV